MVCVVGAVHKKILNILFLWLIGKRVFLHYGDLCDYISLENVINDVKPEFVFHLAAQSFPKTSFSSPINTYDTNVQGTETYLRRLENVIQLILGSMSVLHQVFGRVIGGIYLLMRIVIFIPASPYAISKVGTDLIGRFHAEAYGQKIIVTRMFTHTGPRRGDVFVESSFAKQIAIEQEQIEPVIRVGNLKSMRTFADVRDAVRAYYLLLTKNPIPGEYYNIGGQFSCKIGEMLDYLLSIFSEKRYRDSS